MMKQRCVFVKHAGRRINETSVAWYDVTFRQLIDEYFNTGDMTVYDSTLKLLDYDYHRSVVVNVDLPVDPVRAAQINEMQEVIVLRASNYIHEEMDWTNFGAWLDAIKLPVLCLGVGAQAVERRRITLPHEGRRIWHVIAERTPSVGVRGAFTASVLNDNGIKNVDVVGCPSIFRHRNSKAELRHVDYSNIRRVSFSLRRETGHNYTSNISEFLDIQKKWILKLNELFDLTLTVHGETEEKSYYYNDPEQLLYIRQRLRDAGWFDPIHGRELEQIYHRQLFFTPVVAHYDEIIRRLDYTIGYRVHGVLPALAVGTPSILLRYDERSAELAETLSVPLLDPKEALGEDMRNIFHRDRFIAFEKNYPRAYQRMREFLDKNDIAHLMKSE